MWFWNHITRHENPEKQIPVPAPATALKIRKSKWEKALPKKYFIATAEQSLTSLKLKVEIETIDTSEQKSVTCLVDSGTDKGAVILRWNSVIPKNNT